MEFRLNLDVKPFIPQITYKNKIMLVGSCFTESIGERLKAFKFDVLQNPHGIIYNPVSICQSIIDCIENKKYSERDLFYLNEVWNSWDHHSRFSDHDKINCTSHINTSIEKAHKFLKATDWLIITLGTSFIYELTNESAESAGTINARKKIVANCHKAPQSWFNKKLLSIAEVSAAMDNLVHRLLNENAKLNIIFTVSPVRHIKDGIIENNRSKAILLESVHHLVNKFDRLHYFPAYELVIDDLRDYRFYTEDMVHPNKQAIDYVWEKFLSACVDTSSVKVMTELKEILTAKKHRPINPSSDSHNKFLKNYSEKAKTLQDKHPYLDLSEEIKYFSGNE